MDEPTIDPTPTDADPDGPAPGWIPPGPPTPSRLRTIGIVAAIFGVIIMGTAFTLGFMSSFLADPDGPPALGSMFGPSYDKLPADFRSGVDARLKAVAPAEWDRLTVAERSAWAVQQLNAGLVRLDDAKLTNRYRLLVTVRARMPTEACGEAAREAADGPLSRGSSEAFFRSFTPEELRSRVEMDLEAIEAQVRATSMPRQVTEVEADRVYDTIISLATPDESEAIQAVLSNQPQADVELCRAIRAFDAASLRLPANDLSTWARHSSRAPS